MEYVKCKGKKYYIEDGVLDLSELVIEDFIDDDIWPFRFDISELKGFNTLTNLKALFLPRMYISEIKLLEKFTDLEILDLSCNEIVEIKGLETLTNLQELYLDGNPITEIKGLETLTELRTLNICDTNILEIIGLKMLTSLRELILSDNKIAEIEGLEKLANLRKLDLSNASNISISGIDRYKDIVNQITEIKGLNTLTNLRELNLSNNKITEIKGLENLINLKRLNLTFNEITEIKGLENLTNLKELNLYGNKIPQKLLKELLYKNIKNWAEKNPELYKISRKKIFFKFPAKKISLEDMFKKGGEITYDILMLTNEYFIRDVLEYCGQKRKEQDIIISPIEKLKEILKKTPKVKLDKIKSALQMDTHIFNNKIVDWAVELDCTIDGDYLVINEDTISEFINILDREFKKWEQGKEKLE